MRRAPAAAAGRHHLRRGSGPDVAVAGAIARAQGRFMEAIGGPARPTVGVAVSVGVPRAANDDRGHAVTGAAIGRGGRRNPPIGAEGDEGSDDVVVVLLGTVYVEVRLALG